MFAVFKKIFLAFVLVLLVLTTGAWQSDLVVLAESQNTSIPVTPLYPGLTWSSLGLSTQNVRININGDSISLPGERYEALEQFPAGLPQDIFNYYSNEQLEKSGWASYDAFDGSDGIHYVFYHESGVYLSVELLKCPDTSSSICVAVWKSEQTHPMATAPGKTSEPGIIATAATFGKTAPTNGATDLNPSSIALSWEAYSGADKYKYCVNDGSACAENDPDWTSTYSRSVTLINLAYNKTYYWQVKATTCETCVPKSWVYANNGTAWKFTTKSGGQVTILGNAGIGGAVLSYTDGTLKKVTADSTGAYSIKVPLNWTGTVTPSKSGYLFSPTSASFTNLTATQTIQNFTAIAVYVISGNAGVAGATLSYTNGTPQTVVSDASGNYSLVVPAGWSGTVTPSKTSYTFSPASRTYSGLATNQTAQNYTATFITYSISGNAGIGGVTLTYTDAIPQFVTADGSGNYSITVPSGWSGTITPRKIGYAFTPASRLYGNVQSNQTSQNYTDQVCASCADADTVGVFRPSNGLLYLKNLNITGFADVAINYGLSGDYPVVGDWDGDGDATLGIYRNGSFYLRNDNSIGFADVVFPFGSPGDQPIAGDWNNDGVDTIGVYRSSTGTFYLRNSNDAGAPDMSFVLGNPGDVGIAGDWNGDGFDTTGVFRPSNGALYLKNTNVTGFADIQINYGIPGDKPVTGDWDNNGTDTIGVYRNGTFYLRNSNTVGFADIVFALGIPGDVPIAGNWDAKP